jgi:hypothetical protein
VGQYFQCYQYFSFLHQVNKTQGWSSQVACCLALDERNAVAVHRLKNIVATASGQNRYNATMPNAVSTASGQNRYAIKAVKTAPQRALITVF